MEFSEFGKLNLEQIRAGFTRLGGIEGFNLLLADKLLVIPVADSISKGVVKTVVQRIGGGRTTDQIVVDAKKVGSYVDFFITQKNMPSGYGRTRVNVLEFFQFDHDPTTDEVRVGCEEPSYGYPTYEDGFRFQEDHPDDQRQAPYIFIPENPWYDGVFDYPRGLLLWSHAGVRGLNLSVCRSEDRWLQHCLFARRKYLHF